MILDLNSAISRYKRQCQRTFNVRPFAPLYNPADLVAGCPEYRCA